MSAGNDTTVGFLGLGALGAPVATNLLGAGLKLRVWNRTSDKAKPLVERGATQVERPADAVESGGAVMTLLWDDASLHHVVTSPDFLSKLKGGVHISITTVSPKKSQEMAKLHADHGCAYVEAPVFGVPAQAVAKQMLFCVAGAAQAKDRARPLLEKAGGAKIFDFGETIGSALATKLAGNYMIVAGMAVLQEVFDTLRANKVDPKLALEMLTTTIAATPGNQRFAQLLLSNGPPPKSGIPLKDVGLFNGFAQAAGGTPALAQRLHEILEKR